MPWVALIDPGGCNRVRVCGLTLYPRGHPSVKVLKRRLPEVCGDAGNVFCRMAKHCEAPINEVISRTLSGYFPLICKLSFHLLARAGITRVRE